MTGKRALGSNILEVCRWDRSERAPGCVPSNPVLLAMGAANRIDVEGASCVDPAVRVTIEATLEAQRRLGWWVRPSRCVLTCRIVVREGEKP